MNKLNFYFNSTNYENNNNEENEYYISKIQFTKWEKYVDLVNNKLNKQRNLILKIIIIIININIMTNNK